MGFIDEKENVIYYTWCLFHQFNNTITLYHNATDYSNKYHINVLIDNKEKTINIIYIYMA